MPFKTADLVDQHDEALRFCNLPFRLYGRRRRFRGEIVTVKCFEDNALLKETLGRPGNGRVLVVDAGGSTRCAVLGDQVAELGRANGWGGVVIHGAIRDSAELDAMEFSVMAIGTSPKKSGKTRAGAVNVPVRFGDAEFLPGEHLYADDDGILVSARKLL
jgi:regulator of ribonuclease activity A